MLRFVLRRLAALPLVLAGVTLLLFGLFSRLSPEMRASLYVTDPRQLSSLEAVVEKHGLRDPFLVQYGRWLKDILRGDLGYSETAKMPVADALAAYFPATIELSAASFIPIVLLGVWLGTRAAVNQDRWVDHLSRFVSITGYSLPSFVLGLFLLMVFYGLLQAFPPGRYSLPTDIAVHSPSFRSWTGLLTLDTLLNGRGAAFLDVARHLVLPAATLTYVSMALLVRVTRSSMLEELSKDYVRTARAKGLPESAVIARHARRNALVPVITVASILLVNLLGGVIITETVFAYPGIGRWVAQAALQLDVPAVMGVSLVSSSLFVLGNLAADVLYAAADPRIRLQ
ncbi:MAG TPA: ABC transporter permease [Elusimicrobiota bacterium]|nr:ABC transporter permease [Elusimicrobiota bacterium]